MMSAVKKRSSAPKRVAFKDIESRKEKREPLEEVYSQAMEVTEEPRKITNAEMSRMLASKVKEPTKENGSIAQAPSRAMQQMVEEKNMQSPAGLTPTMIYITGSIPWVPHFAKPNVYVAPGGEEKTEQMLNACHARKAVRNLWYRGWIRRQLSK